MGHIVKKILGDVNTDPEYKNLTIEYNADGMVHIHLGPIRLDLVKSAYNQLYDGVMEAQKKMSESHGWTQITKTHENKKLKITLLLNKDLTIFTSTSPFL